MGNGNESGCWDDPEGNSLKGASWMDFRGHSISHSQLRTRKSFSRPRAFTSQKLQGGPVLLRAESRAQPQGPAVFAAG